MAIESRKINIEDLKLNIEHNKEDNILESFDTEDKNDDYYLTDGNVTILEIIQRKTSKSLLRTKYKRDRIQVVLFFMGFFGFPIISWGISWIIGKTCIKPKSHRGKKLRQLNGILTLICIFLPAIFSYFYYQSLVFSSYDTNNIFIESNIHVNNDKLKTSNSITKTKKSLITTKTQILSCSSELDIEIVIMKQDQSEEKGLVLFIGKLIADTWLKSKVLDEAYNNGFTVAAVSPPGYGKSGKLTNSKIGNNFETISSSSFLFWLVNNCLKFETRKVVIVTHSNSITQKYVIPLIMSYPIAGIVFFNTNMGIKWFNAKNPIINDHLYYQPINFNNTIVRYIGDKEPLVVSSNTVENQFESSKSINFDETSSNDEKRVHISNQISISNTKRPTSKNQAITTTTKATTTTTTTTFSSSSEGVNNSDISNDEKNIEDLESSELNQLEQEELQHEELNKDTNSGDSTTMDGLNNFLESSTKTDRDETLNEKESYNDKINKETKPLNNVTFTTTKKPTVTTTNTTKKPTVTTTNTTKKPTVTTTTKKPTVTTTTKKPTVTTTTTKKPTAATTTTKKPTATTTTKKPTVTTTTKKPTATTTTKKPIVTTTTKKPTATTTTKKPTAATTTTKKPTVTTTTKKPTAITTTTKKPTVTTTTKKPTAATTTTKKPTVTTITKKPTVITTTTKKPTVTTTTKKPTAITTTTKKPTVTTTTKKPTAATTTTKKPTVTTITKKPTVITTTTKKPTVTTTTTKKMTLVTTKPPVKTVKTTKSVSIKNMQNQQQYLHAQKLMNKRFLIPKNTYLDKNYDKGVSNITKVINHCIAPNVTYKYDQRWYITEQNKMGPFGWFDGKYTIPGWRTMQMAYESFDFDNFDSKRLSNGTYLLTLDYFIPLIETLNEILPLIAQRIAFSNINSNNTGINNSNNQTIISENIQEAPTTWNSHRRNAYLKYRANYELIPAQEIYCTN
ncbi:putative integral membrane protein [Cryptosporidium meleagridis]|uniref:Putative integral membrane protein n=2 Tax=Cryptosporidium meleagridis TaxID=93969 RepID=A0A2P4Z4P2_9CRYT|nr:putative integral membrane protein [Cryptosporidium meleagridis]